VNLLPSSYCAAQDQGCAGPGDPAQRTGRKCAALDLLILRKKIKNNIPSIFKSSKKPLS